MVTGKLGNNKKTLDNIRIYRKIRYLKIKNSDFLEDKFQLKLSKTFISKTSILTHQHNLVRIFVKLYETTSSS